MRPPIDRDDFENTGLAPDQYEEELAAPEDQSGLLGDMRPTDESGLVGTPKSPDNTGLLGSTSGPYDESITDGGRYESTADDMGLSGQARTPETELLDPGYNPRIGNAGTLDDINRAGQPGAPDHRRGYPRMPSQPDASGYSGTANRPGYPDQTGTQDQVSYGDQSGASSSDESGS